MSSSLGIQHYQPSLNPPPPGVVESAGRYLRSGSLKSGERDGVRSSSAYHKDQPMHFMPPVTSSPMSEEAKNCTLEQKLTLVYELRRKALFKKARGEDVDACTLAKLMNSIAVQDVGYRQGLRNNKLPRVHISGVSFNSTPSTKGGEKPVETLTVTFRDEQSGSNLFPSLLVGFNQLMQKSS